MDRREVTEFQQRAVGRHQTVLLKANETQVQQDAGTLWLLVRSRRPFAFLFRL